MTIEVTDNPSKKFFEAPGPRLLPVAVQIERLDRLTFNLAVEDEDCDELTDWLDEHGFQWRLV